MNLYDEGEEDENDALSFWNEGADFLEKVIAPIVITGFVAGIAFLGYHAYKDSIYNKTHQKNPAITQPARVADSGLDKKISEI